MRAVFFISLVAELPLFLSPLVEFRLSQLIGSTLALDYLRAGKLTPKAITPRIDAYSLMLALTLLQNTSLPSVLPLLSSTFYSRAFWWEALLQVMIFMSVSPGASAAHFSCIPVADMIGLTGNDSGDIRGDWDRGLWVHK